MFLGAAYYPDVDYHVPTEGCDVSSSWYATSLSVMNYDLQYDVSFVTSM